MKDLNIVIYFFDNGLITDGQITQWDGSNPGKVFTHFSELNTCDSHSALINVPFPDNWRPYVVITLNLILQCDSNQPLWIQTKSRQLLENQPPAVKVTLLYLLLPSTTIIIITNLSLLILRKHFVHRPTPQLLLPFLITTQQ